MHTSGFISPILTHNTTPSFSVLCDSAFPRNDPSLVGKLVRARKVNEMGKSSDTPNCTYLAAVDVLLERAIPSGNGEFDPSRALLNVLVYRYWRTPTTNIGLLCSVLTCSTLERDLWDKIKSGQSTIGLKLVLHR